MPLSNEQVGLLKEPLERAHVATRKQGNSGPTLSYIEGWWAIAEANRIFGYDGWTRELVDLRCVAERERRIGRPPHDRDGWGVSYVAKVKVVVFAGDDLVTREGVGAGHGIDADLGNAHESAVKEAETDAMKRALSTFGWPLGLALYDKKQEHVTHSRAKPNSSSQTKDRDEWGMFIQELSECDTVLKLERLREEYRKNVFPKWPSQWPTQATQEFDARQAELTAGDLPGTLADSVTETRADYIQHCHERIAEDWNSSAELLRWWNGQASERRRFSLTKAESDALKDRTVERREELDAKAKAGEPMPLEAG